MLEGDDPGGWAFALSLRPHPGAFRQLMCLHAREFAHLFKKNANAPGLAQGGMGTAGIDRCIIRYMSFTLVKTHNSATRE